MPNAEPLSAELREAVRREPFVFFGTVRSSRGSNVESLNREDIPTAVLHVDDVVSAPHTLGDIVGRDITVRLAGPVPRAGQRLLIAASSLVYSEALAVDEVARAAPGRRTEQLRRQVFDERIRQMDDDLRARLAMAKLVVYGRVESSAPYSPESGSAGPPAVGEAAPSWRVANVLVWRFLKGSRPERPRVVFPYERTQKWSEVPLLIPESEGIWLLHELGHWRAQNPAWQPPLVIDGFEAPDPLDFQAPSAIDRLRLLLQLPAAGERS
jgi:hypothetical protein